MISTTLLYIIIFFDDFLYIIYERLTIGYFDNFDNGSLNKYIKKFKNEKKNYRCILLLMD
jgi:hypothetical protein